MVLFCARAIQLTIPSSHAGLTVLFEPPKSINASFYRCDNKFHLDNVLDMYNTTNVIGVCLASGEELLIYKVSITGSHIEPTLCKKIQVKLPNKQKKGGQSAVRFARNADIARNQCVNKFVEQIIAQYMKENNTICNVTKIIIAGYGFMCDDIIQHHLFQQYLSKYLYKKLSINSISDTTVISIIKDLEITIATDLSKQVDNIIQSLVTDENFYDLLGFGFAECIKYMESGNITKLYVRSNHIEQETRDVFMKFPNLEVIESESTQLELYGGWLCVKKYSETN